MILLTWAEGELVHGTRRWSALPWVVEGKGHCSVVPPALGLTAGMRKLGKGPGNAMEQELLGRS